MNETNSKLEGLPELKLCPCCDFPPQLNEDYKCFGADVPGWQIRCDKCGLQTCWWHSLEDAMLHWNTRVPVEGEMSDADAEAYLNSIAAPLTTDRVLLAKFLATKPTVLQINLATRIALEERERASIPTDKLEGEEKHSVNEDKDRAAPSGKVLKDNSESATERKGTK